MIEPKNEQGVIVLFENLSKKLGYKIVSVQTRFPDAVISDRKGREYVAEFEYRSRNFIGHGHDPEKCDLIICWIDDLGEYKIPILSLKNYLDYVGYKKIVFWNSTYRFLEITLPEFFLYCVAPLFLFILWSIDVHPIKTVYFMGIELWLFMKWFLSIDWLFLLLIKKYLINR